MGNAEDTRSNIEHSGFTPENWPINPRGHRDRALIERKIALIDAPHVSGLNGFG